VEYGHMDVADVLLKWGALPDATNKVRREQCDLT